MSSLTATSASSAVQNSPSTTSSSATSSPSSGYGYDGNSSCTSTLSSFSGNTGSGSGSPLSANCNSTSTSSFLASTARMHQSNSPHGILPLRQLVPIKIMDRQSCFVNGIDISIAKDEILRSNQYFGQFGTITSIRFILNSDPAQALLRFETEEAAARANAWCNHQTSPECPISAKHGYQKYCISFIKNKQCVKPGCPHRHRWCAPDDIITVKNQTFKVRDTPADIFTRSKKKKKSANRVSPVKTPTAKRPIMAMDNLQYNLQQSIPPRKQALGLGVPPQRPPVNVSKTSSTQQQTAEQLMIVQRQFSILQLQHTQQTESVKMLLVQMKALQAENRMLQSVRAENRMLRQQLGQTAHYRPALFHPTATTPQKAPRHQRLHEQQQQARASAGQSMVGITPYYPSKPLSVNAINYQHEQQLLAATSSTDEEMVSDIIDSLFQSDELMVSESSESV